MQSRAFEARMAHIEGAFEQMNERFGAVERRFDAVDRRFDAADRRFDQMDRRFNWLTGIVVGTWTTTILAIFLHH